MAVFLNIVQIIAFILLGLLLLIVVLILSLLLLPFRYELKLRYKDKFFLALDVSYIFKLFLFELRYDKGLSTAIRICGRKLKPKAGGEDEELAEEEFTEEELVKEKLIEGIEEEDISEAKGTVFDEEDVDSDKNNIELDAEQDTKQSKAKTKNRKKNFIEFIKSEYEELRLSFRKMCKRKERISKLIQDESLKAGIIKTLKALWELIKLLNPRKINGHIIFGLSDPYTMGNILSYISYLYALYKDRIDIVPVFDEEIVDVDLEAKGKLRLMPVVYIGTKLVLDKDFKRLYKVYKNIHKIW